jgi:hypothetical protein
VDYFIEGIGYFPLHTGPMQWKSDGEIPGL